MTTIQIKRLFQLAATFNICVALTLLLATDLFIKIFQLGVPTTQPLFAHLFGIVVLAFGGLYYYISNNPQSCRNEMYFSMYAKLGVVAVCIVDTIIGNVIWTVNLLAVFDLIFALLFYQAAQPLKDFK